MWISDPTIADQSAYIEHFNRTFREKVIDPYLFSRLENVHEAAWRQMLDYSKQCLHDTSGKPTPTKHQLKAAGIFTFSVLALTGKLTI
jgi:putative transposase